MSLTKIICLLLIIVSTSVLVENRSYNTGLIFYNLENHNAYLPPTISVSRGRGLAKFKYSSRGSIWSTFGKPCDCSGALCGCCVGIKVKQFNFDQKMCANVSYVSPKEEIQLEVFLNDTSTAKYGVAARNPSPLCVPIMMGIPMSMCIQMSNIGIQGDNLNMCMDFLVRLASTELFEMHFQCMKMGLQGIGWVGADGQPVIPANEGKIKDRSGDESNEYYDEEENEVISKEKEKENEIVMQELEESAKEEDTNKAEEDMDYNDITEKIMDIVKEKEEENLIGSHKEKLNIKDNGKEEEEFKEGINEIENLHKDDNEEHLFDLKAEESKIESPVSIEETAAMEEIVDQSKEKETDKQTDKFVIIPEEIIPEVIKETTSSEEDTDNSKETEYYILSQETPEDQNFANYGNIMETIAPQVTPEEINVNSYDKEMTAASEIEKENSIANNEGLQSEEQMSSEFDKFEMLHNDDRYTTQFIKTENNLNNSLENLDMPLKSTTEQYTVDNLKPTMPTTTITTSEINNVDKIDNALTTATIMNTTTTIETKTTEKVEDNDAATNMFENTFNNNNSNDSDNSLENDSDYEDEESDENVEDEDNDERIENKKTTAAANLNTINSNNDNDNKANAINKEKDHKETTTIDFPNATSSEESNSVDADNHNEDISDEGDDDEVEDNNDSDEEEEEEYEENEAETTTITDTNNIDKTLMSSSLNKKNTINNTRNDILTSSTNNPQLTTFDTTIDMTSSNNFLLNSLASTTLASDTDNNIVNTSNNISQITVTHIPLPLARKLLTHHRYHSRNRQHH